jgi:hypothetical protein
MNMETVKVNAFEPAGLEVTFKEFGDYAELHHADEVDSPDRREPNLWMYDRREAGNVVHFIRPKIGVLNAATLLGDFDAPEVDALLNSTAIYAVTDRAPKVTGDKWGQTVGTVADLVRLLSIHPEKRDKGGDALFFAESPLTGESSDKGTPFSFKLKSKIQRVFALAIDVDGGTTVETVIARLRAAGFFAVIYTTHSHTAKGKPGSDRFRVILPLSEPFELGDRDADPAAWEARYADWMGRYFAVCEIFAGDGDFDASASLPSQLMYAPSRPKGAEYKHYILAGLGLDLSAITPVDYRKYRKAGPTGIARDGEAHDGAPAILSDGFDLMAWHGDHGENFLLSDFLEMIGWDVGGSAGAGFDMHCPNAAAHTSGGNTAWGIDGTEADNGATIYCHHSHCNGLATWNFLHLIESQCELPAGYDHLSQVLCDPMFYGEVLDGEAVNRADYVEEVIVIDWIKTPAAVKRAFGELSEHSSRDAYAALYAGVGKGGGRPAVLTALDNLIKGSKLFKANEITALAARGKDLLEDDRAAYAAHQKAIATEAEEDARAKLRAEPREIIELSAATRETVEAAAKNAGWLPTGYHYDNGWFFKTNYDAPSKSKRTVRAFEVPYVAFGDNDEGDRTNEITIRYPHRSAQAGIVESRYRIGDAYRDSGTFVSRLADEGLEFDPQADIANILALLRSVNTDCEAILMEKAGWSRDKHTYILPTGEAVTDTGHRYVLNPAMRVSARKDGDLAQWSKYSTIALLGENGAQFMPGYLSGAVGCLADFLDHEMSPILYNEGKANRGKSTSLRAGASWFAYPDQTGLFLKGDATATAGETHAERGNGSAVIYDEEGTSRYDPAEKQRRALQDAEGSGRGRGKADGGMRATKTWKTCFARSTEQGFLASMIAEQAKDRSFDIKTGPVSRIFTVNYDAVTILDEVKHATVLAAYKQIAYGGVYGVAAEAYARKLLALGVAEVRGRFDEVMKEWAGVAQGAGRRVVAVAALFVVAGEVAQEAAIFSEEVPVRRYMHGLLLETLAAREGHLNTETQALEGLRRGIILAIQRGEIIEAGVDRLYENREIVGYWLEPTGLPKQVETPTLSDTGKKTPEQKAEEAAQKAEEDWYASLAARIYILPIDRLSKLGVKTDITALAKQLHAAKALVTAPNGARERFRHTKVPGEGVMPNIRVTGAFVHGDMNEDDAVALGEQ